MPLSRKPAPFDHPEWVFELKYDGFRSLAVIQNGRAELISRNGHPFKSFPDLRQSITSRIEARRCSTARLSAWTNAADRASMICSSTMVNPCFFAFDLLMTDGKDIRTEKLTDRKHELRRLMSKVPDSRMRYVEHVEHYGTALFERVCKMDLEGIVAKHATGIMSPKENERRGSRSRIGTIPRWKAGRNCSSENVTRNQFPAGIAVISRVRR